MDQELLDRLDAIIENLKTIQNNIYIWNNGKLDEENVAEIAALGKTELYTVYNPIKQRYEKNNRKY